MSRQKLLEREQVGDLLAQLYASSSAAERAKLCHKFGASLEVVEALKVDVDRFKNADGKRALEAGQLAAEVSSLVADPVAKPLGWWSLALGLTAAGQYLEALPYFERARKSYLHLGRSVEAARAALRQVQALAMTGDFDAATLLAQEVHNTFVANKLMREAAQSQISLGAIYGRTGKNSDAHSALTTALAEFSAIDDEVGAAQARVNLGYVCQAQDDFTVALEHFETALTLFLKFELVQSAAGTLVEIALLHRKEGRLPLSLTCLSRAREMYKSLDDNLDSNLAQLGEAQVNLDLNLLKEAQELALDVIAKFSVSEMKVEHADALLVLGVAQAKEGRMEEAVATFREAKERWLNIGNQVQGAWVDLYQAGMLVKEGQTAAAHHNTLLEANELAEVALMVMKAEGIRSGQALAYLTAAEAQTLRGEYKLARVSLAAALELSTELDIIDYKIRGKRLSGHLATLQKQWRLAEAEFREAIQLLESMRASLPVDEFKTAYLGDKTAVYSDLVSLLLNQGQIEDAFEYTERAKSRSLLDLLTRGLNDFSLPSEGTGSVADLKRRLREARAGLNRYTLAFETNRDDRVMWEMVVSAEREVTSLSHEIERLSPRTAAFQGLAASPLGRLLEQLSFDQVIVEYFSIGTDFVAFVVTNEGIRVKASLASIEKVKYRLDRLNFFLDRVAQGGLYTKLYGGEAGLQAHCEEQLAALYDLLLRPLELELAGKQLIVIPHGVLHAVPFAALFGDQQYLLEQTRVVLSPSSAVYLHCVDRVTDSSPSLVAFAATAEDLAAVQGEVAAIAQLAEDPQTFLNDEATSTAFFQHAPNADVVHIAAHGRYRPDNPLYSGLRFQDGWLTARDLYNIELNASLVVLAACESGLSSGHGGDEQLGLVRGFLYAGVPALAVSLWPVKDEQTRLLMTKFYELLYQGREVSDALKTAQLAVRERWPNPYYWAGFTMLGDSKRILKRSEPVRNPTLLEGPDMLQGESVLKSLSY